MPDYRKLGEDKDGVLFQVTEPILGNTEIELIRHALDQMEIRDISLEDVCQTLRKPDAIVPQSNPNRMRVRDNKTVRVAIDVVYEKLTNRLRIITAIKVERRIVERKRGAKDMKRNYEMTISTDKATGRLLAVYFQVRKGHAAKVREFAHGNAIANYSATGKLLGVELLGPCSIRVLDQITREPEERSFLKGKVPRELVIA